MPPPGLGTALRMVSDATCLACGCLCDDIELTVSDGRIVEALRACPLGRAWFLDDHGREDRPIATVDGQPATPPEAIARAASILKSARSPLILGLTHTTMETQALAVALADRLAAAIDPGDSAASGPRWSAIQRIGRVSATLGEVKDRADLVVFWGVDPTASHPRHAERYSIEPPGRFLPGGRADRTVVFVGPEHDVASSRPDRFFSMPPDREVHTLSQLRSLVRGVDPASPVEPAWLDLAQLLMRASYGALFFGPELGRRGSLVVESLLTLVRDLNSGDRRFVVLGLGSAGNPTGAEAVLTWQAGAPFAVSFGGGSPTFLPGEATAEALLSRGAADAVLIVADQAPASLSPAARDQLARIPAIRLAPNATTQGRLETVGLASATPGIHAGGTVMRVDGITLPLRATLTTDLPTDTDWLRALLEALPGLSPRS